MEGVVLHIQLSGSVPDAGIKHTLFITLPSRELFFRGNKQPQIAMMISIGTSSAGVQKRK